MAEWTEEAEARLVELWANAPCLYDTTTKSYSTRTTKRRAFEELERETNMSGKFEKECNLIFQSPVLRVV